MSKEEKFWNWFKENNSKYYFLNQITNQEVKEKLLDDFLKHLHSYCDRLFFQIGGLPNGPQELVISAEGNKDYFEKVEGLVSQAPKINNWQIIAFKPSVGIDFITDYENIKFNPKEMWFLPLDNENEPKQLGLILYLNNYNSKKHEVFLAGCYQVLDAVLGEKSCALDVNHLEVDKLPKNPVKHNLIELASLANYIKWRKAKL